MEHDSHRKRPADHSPLEEIEHVRKRFEKFFREAEKCVPAARPAMQREDAQGSLRDWSSRRLLVSWLSLGHLLRKFLTQRAALALFVSSALFIIVGSAVYLIFRESRSLAPAVNRELGTTLRASTAKAGANRSLSSPVVPTEADAKDSFYPGAVTAYESEKQPTVLPEPRNQEQLDQLLLDPAARQVLLERIRSDQGFQIRQSWPSTAQMQYSPSDLAILAQHGILTQTDTQLLQVIQQATHSNVPMKE